MMRLPFIAMVAAVVFAVGCRRRTVEEKIAALPPIIQAYKVDPYIEVAGQLQTLGREAGCSALLRAATNSSGFGDYSIFTLCRMLFTNQPSSGGFRRPAMGGATFLGGTSYGDWPLEPIELVDGVPFVIANRYMLSGQMEPPAAYVRWCMTECAWSSAKFSPKTRHQKEAALTKLLASTKWRTPVSQGDQEYFAAQVR